MATKRIDQFSTVTPDGTEFILVQNPTTLQYSKATATGVGSTGSGAVSSVAGKTGAVSLTKSDVGLSNVDNTADASKPVSTAQAAADALKANISGQVFTGAVSATNLSGTNTGDETTSTIKTKLGVTTLSGSNTGDQDLSGYATTSALTTGLATKANTTHTHAESDVTGLTSDLAAKQATLVSGTNIKTVNGNSLLGSGDLTLSSGGSSTLAGDTDVVITSPANKDLLTYDTASSKWTNQPAGSVSVPDATTTSKGIVQLAGDLGGTAAAPTVPGLATKSDFTAPTFTQNYPRTQPVSVDQMETGWTDEYGVGTTSFDTSTYIEGTKSIKVVTPTTTAFSGMSKTGTFDYSTSNFKLWVKSDNWNNVSVARIYFMTDASNYYVVNLNIIFQDMVNTIGTAYNEWYDLFMTHNKFTVTGSPSWSNITKIVVAAASNTGTTANVWFDGLAVYQQAAKGVVSISFDDGWDTGYNTGMKYMEQYGYTGTAFIIPSLLGTTNYMTQANVDDIAKKGWDISGHGATDLTTFSNTVAEADVKATAQYLNSNNYPGANVYAYPNGMNNTAIRGIVGKYFPVARTINYFTNLLTAVNPLRLNALSPTNAWTSAQVNAYVDDAVSNGNWCVLTFHKIVTTATGSTEFSTANFQSVIDHIAASGIEVQPISRVLERDWMNAVPSGSLLTQTNTVTGITNKRFTLPETDGTGIKLNGSTSGSTIVKAAAAAGSGTLTLPTASDTLIGRASTDTITGVKNFTAGKLVLFGSTSGSVIVNAPAVAGTTTITMPGATGTLATLGGTETLTNKTLTAPVISTITNTGTLTLPTATGTVALTSSNITGTSAGITGKTTPTGAIVGDTDTQTLTNKTLTTPTITYTNNSIPAAALATTAINLTTYTVTTSVSMSTSTTTETTIISGAFTVPAGGRKLELTAIIPQLTTGVTGERFRVTFYESSTALQRFYIGTSLYGWSGTLTAIINAPTAGSHTYFLAAVRDVGTGTPSAYADATGSNIVLSANMI